MSLKSSFFTTYGITALLEYTKLSEISDNLVVNNL